jgi:hypothetical protein
LSIALFIMMPKLSQAHRASYPDIAVKLPFLQAASMAGAARGGQLAGALSSIIFLGAEFLHDDPGESAAGRVIFRNYGQLLST